MIATRTLGLLAGCALSASAQIVITEIHYHPVAVEAFNADGTPVLQLTNDLHEFVELQNLGASTVDLSGWTLGGGIGFTFPTNTSIASGAFRVIAKVPSLLAGVYGLEVANVLGPYSGHLGNSGDTVRVSDATGNPVDAVTYSANFPWAQAADALGASDRFTGLSSTNYQYKGRSLQRVSVTWPSSDPANWLASPLSGPTPGAAQAVTRAIPKPVVVAFSAVQTTNGAIIIRSNATVTVNCTYSATNSLTNVTLEYFVENVNLTNQAHTSVVMTNLAGASYSAIVPGQTNRAVVRYRFKADRGDGLEVVSPRADDPQIAPLGTNNTRESWWGYYVTPVRTTTNAATYEVFVSTANYMTMTSNIEQNPKRVTAASALGLPRDTPYVALTSPRWEGSVPALFCTAGQVYDIQIRFHGSVYHRAPSDHSFELAFPDHQPLNGFTGYYETMHGQEYIEAQKIVRLLGLPCSQMRLVDWYFNATTNEVHSEQGRYDASMLDAWSQLRQQLNPGLANEAAGDLFKCVGNRDPSQNNNEGPYTRGDEAPMLSNSGWSQIQRYSWNFSLESNKWKGHKPLRDLLEGMWAARGDFLASPNFTNSAAKLASARAWFTNNWDIDLTLTSMALLEWMAIWDDAAQNHFFWRRANGLWSRLGWDYDLVMGASGQPTGTLGGNGGGPGGGGGAGGTTNQTIYGGEAGAPVVFDGVNWFMDTFFKCFRSEYNQRLWQLNNSFFDPTNLTAQGFTVAPGFAVNRRAYINSVLSALGTYYKPNRPVNVYPASGGTVVAATNLVTKPYTHPQNTPQLATIWEIRTPTGTYEEPLLRLVTTNSCLTNYPIPFDQLTYGQTYYWRATHLDTNGHPSIVSAETSFSWGTASTSAGTLVLNEILADNRASVQNGGTRPGYLELRNNGSSPFNLSGYALTDDPTNTTRYLFPTGTTIAAGGYLLVWCDANLGAPGLHSGFSLAAGGQTILLLNGATIVDSVTFGPQAPDVAIGRIADGVGGWQANAPTPGAANTATPLGSVANLRVNEWMADPAYGDDWFELYNTDSNAVALAGLYLSDTPSTPMITQIPALSFIAGDGWTRFWADGSAAGGSHCNFKLNKSGESLVLTAANGATTLDTITFSTQTKDVSQGRLPDGASTLAFFTNTASPGYCNWVVTNVVINELLANPGAPLEDALELYNSASAAQAIGGWWLSDDLASRKKFQVPAGTIIPALGYKVFYAADFAAGAVPFTFGPGGGHAVLSAVDASGDLNGAAALVSYGAAATNVSFGRVEATGLNCTLGGAEFWPLAAHTFGQDNPPNVAAFRLGAGVANAAVKTGPAILNEIMYHPPDTTNLLNGVTNVADDSFDEFIELHNLTTNTVDLSGWMLAGDLGFTFPGGAALAPAGYLLLVSFDPSVATNLSAFRAHYNLTSSVPIYGPYSDKLPNSTAVLELVCPFLLAGYTNYVLVDKVEYRDSSPWPGAADGGGQSLSRASSSVIGNNAANWGSKQPTPGALNHDVVTNAVILTTSPLPGALLHVGYTHSFLAAGGAPPYAWKLLAGSVPGLTLATNGTLAGTPAVAGTNSLSVQLADSVGFTTNLTFTLVVAAAPPAIATGSPLPVGTVDEIYSQTFTATGGTGPYAWSVAGGTLPAGLSLNGAGVIGGAPATNGSYSFTVQAIDAFGLTASGTFSLAISPAGLAITSASPMANAVEGAAYSQVLTAAGGVAPYTWSVAAGSLPAGLALDALGDIAGIPTALGTFNFTVELTDDRGANVTQSLALSVVSPTLAILTPALPDGNLGAAYSQLLAASGGTPPYTWSIVWEALPPGLSLSGAGRVSGTPTNVGTFSFVVQSADQVGASTSQLFTIEIDHNTPLLSVLSCAGGVVTLQVAGDTGSDYVVESSTNLLDWISVFTTNAAATPFRWRGDAVTNPACFFRALVLP